MPLKTLQTTDIRTVTPCCESLVSVASLVAELSLLEGRAIDIQSKANLVSGRSFGAIFAPNVPRPLHPLSLKLSVTTMELLALTSSRQFPKAMYVYGSAPWQPGRGRLLEKTDQPASESKASSREKACYGGDVD